MTAAIGCCYKGCHVMTLVRMGDATLQNFDMQTRTKAGRPIWLNVGPIIVTPNGSGGPLTIHLFRDVTATKELLKIVS